MAGPAAPPAPRQDDQLRLFPSAAQPNIIRAYEKDEGYLQFLTDSCHDAVRRLLGPRQALLWARETALLAELLYHGLTTGSGLQTLGEEYCDVMQVTGRIGVPPGPLRRGVLVLLQTLGPYLAERVSAPQDEGFATWQAMRWQEQQQGQLAAGAGGPAPATSMGSLRQAVQQLGTWTRQAQTWVQQALQPNTPGRPAACLRFAWEHSGTLLRLHLALFYIYGAYFQPAKRATGVRYLFAGRSFEGRPSYHVLGLLLLAQLGLSGALWAARSLGQAEGGAPLLRPLGAWAGGGRAQPAKPRHAVLLEEDGSEVAAEPAAGVGDEGSGAGVAAGRKCPLCLSARCDPTATPCGHVFCWRCIAEWVSQKPECPLCRSDVAPSTLVCVRHADF